MSNVPPPPKPVPPPPSLSAYPPPGSKVMSKVMTFAAVGMGIGFGTCSVAALAVPGYKAGQFLIATGAGVFFVCLAVLIICGIIAAVNAIMASFKQ